VIRPANYVAYHHPGGRSLMTAGVWTKTKVALCSRDPLFDKSCPRCSAAVECRLHRLWQCLANRPFRDVLLQVVVRTLPPGTNVEYWFRRLPISALRCGLFPDSTKWPSTDAADVIVYLADVNHHANEASAAHKQNKPAPPAQPGQSQAQAFAALRCREHAPIRRKQLGTHGPAAQCEFGATETGTADRRVFSLDGSFD